MLSAALPEDVSDAESNGGDIPANAIEDTKAVEEQVNGELQERVEEEVEATNEDDEDSVEEEGV